MPDFPLHGIVFFDIFQLLKDSKLLRTLTEELLVFANAIDVVGGIEARGLILGSAVALHLGKVFSLYKKGKLPGITLEESYSLEYAKDTLEIQEGVLNLGDRVFLMKKVLATSGALVAGVKLIHQSGVEVESIVKALEIEVLPGRKTFTGEFLDIALSLLFIK